MRFWNENATPPITARTGEEIAAFLTGLDLLEPGPVSCSRRRPEDGGAAVVPQYGAVAVKPRKAPPARADATLEADMPPPIPSPAAAPATSNGPGPSAANWRPGACTGSSWPTSTPRASAG